MIFMKPCQSERLKERFSVPQLLSELSQAKPIVMTRRILIQFPDRTDDGDYGLLHRVRNLGEDLYRTFRDSGLGQLDLDQIDRTINTLVIDKVKAKQVTRAVKLIEKVTEAHFQDRSPRITVEPT